MREHPTLWDWLPNQNDCLMVSPKLPRCPELIDLWSGPVLTRNLMTWRLCWEAAVTTTSLKQQAHTFNCLDDAIQTCAFTTCSWVLHSLTVEPTSHGRFEISVSLNSPTASCTGLHGCLFTLEMVLMIQGVPTWWAHRVSWRTFHLGAMLQIL